MSITNLGKKIMVFFAFVLLVVGVAACGTTKPTNDAKKEAEANAQTVLGKINWDESDRTAITSSLTLSTGHKQYPNVTVTWTSSDDTIINSQGVVTRPAADDARCVTEGENVVAKVTLTATAVSTYEENGETKTTDPVAKQFSFSVLAIAAGTDTGTIKDVKARAWNYIYVENNVEKKLSSNSNVVYNVLIKGVVIAKLNANGATSGFTIHDGTEGIYVYAKNTDLAIGDVVEVIGEIYSYYGNMQVGSNVTVNKSNDTMTVNPEYKVVTPQQWEDATKDLGDNVIGRLGAEPLKVEGYLTQKDATGGSSDKYCVTDAETGEVSWIYYKSYSEDMQAVLDANVGKYVQLKGVSYDRDSRTVKNELLWDGGIEEVTAPEVSDESKANVILSGISCPSVVKDDFDLSAGGVWTVVSGTAIVIEDGVAKVTCGDAEQEVVLKVTVTVGTATVTKEFTVKVAAGKITTITIAEALALCGTEKDKYTEEKYNVMGTIVSISNPTYGNLKIKDATGELDVYGSYSFDGSKKFGELENVPQVGDTLVLSGVLGFYTAAQMKSGWIVATEIGTTYETVSYETAMAAVPNENDTTTEKYLVKGVIKEFTNTTYGNCVIKDVLGNELIVYGLYDNTGVIKYGDITENKPEVGDFVVVEGIMTNFKGTKEMKNGWLKQVNRVDFNAEPVVRPELTTDFTTTSFADLEALVPEAGNTTTDKYYAIGYVKTVATGTYVNITIEDAEGKTLLVFRPKSFDGAIELKNADDLPQVGDVVVFYGEMTNYNGTKELQYANYVQNGTEVFKRTAAYVMSTITVAETALADFALSADATWTVKSGEGIVIEASTAKVTRGEADQTVVLTASVTIDGETVTKDFTVVVKAEETELAVGELPAALAFTSAVNKADGDAYMTANYPSWTVAGKLGQLYGGYLGFGRSGDASSSIMSSKFSVAAAFTVSMVLKGYPGQDANKQSVVTSYLVAQLVDENGNVVATGSANSVTEIIPETTDTTYEFSFTFVDGKTWTDVSNFKISFTKVIGNIGLKSLTFNK